MNEKINKLIKNPKLLVAVGIFGMLLVLISSFIPSGETKESVKTGEYTAAQYTSELEQSVKSIVKGISGDKNPTVVITLESGLKYSYVSASETDTSSSGGGSSEESRESKKQSFITVKTADGGEQALLVTEIMPQIRGVAIICKGGNDEIVAEKIENAVTAALNITSKRVYISGGAIQ